MKKKLNYREQQRLYEKKTSEIIRDIAAVYFIVITAVFPLFITWTKYSSFTFQKTVFFWITTGAAAAAILFMLFFVKKSFYPENYFIENEPKRRVSVTEWALLAFILLAFISAAAASFNLNAITNVEEFSLYGNHVNEIIWSGSPGRYEGFISFLFYVLTFFIIARFYKPKQLHFLILAGSSILVSLYGILQFIGIDIFNLFPFMIPMHLDSGGKSLYGPLSAYFRTTLGNVNIVAAYCSFAVVLFAALFAVSHAKFKIKWLYLAASAISFALLLISHGDASRVAVLGAMVLLIPYWISDRVRLGNILIVLSGWCAVYAGYASYASVLKKRLESGFSPPHLDRIFLENFNTSYIAPFIILAVVLLALGLVLILVLKKWADKPLKTAGIIFIPLIIVMGLLTVEIMGARRADNPSNIVYQAREILHGNMGDSFGSYRGWIWKNAVSVIPNHPILGTGPDTFFYALGDEIQTASMTVSGEPYDKAHNIFLQIAVCMGIPALLAYLAFAGSLFVSALKKAFERPVLLAFFACAFSYMIQSFFCVEVPITTPLVWVAFGVIAGEIWREKIGAKDETEI